MRYVTRAQFRTEMVSAAEKCNIEIADTTNLATRARVMFCIQAITASVCANFVDYPVSLCFSAISIGCLVVVAIVTHQNNALTRRFLSIRNEALSNLDSMNRQLGEKP